MMKKLHCNALAVFAICAFLAAFSVNTAVAAESEARRALESTVNQVLAEMRKPELKNPATRAATLNRIEQIVRQLFSFDDLARLSLGQHRNKFTPEQLREFSAAFEDLLRATYLYKLDGYNGEVVNYTSENQIDANRVDIATNIVIQGKNVPVSYRMTKRSGRWLVYDVVIEGVSMVQNYRNQFNDMFRTGSPESVIQRVHQLSVEAQNKN